MFALSRVGARVAQRASWSSVRALASARAFSVEKRYTENHEWIAFDGSEATIGVTDHAASELGDVVYVELPEVGAKFSAGDVCASVESVKAAGNVYAPVDIEVTSVNSELEDSPGTVNDGAESQGYMFKAKVPTVAQLEELMDEAGYKKFVDSADD